MIHASGDRKKGHPCILMVGMEINTDIVGKHHESSSKKTYNSSRQPPFFSPPPAVTDIWDLIPWLEDLRLKSFTNTNLLMNIHKNENSLSKRYLHSYVDHSAIHNTQHKGNELSVHNGICSSAIKR